MEKNYTTLYFSRIGAYFLEWLVMDASTLDMNFGFMRKQAKLNSLFVYVLK